MDIELHIPLLTWHHKPDVPQVTEEAGKEKTRMQTYGSSKQLMIEANYEMFTVVEKTIADFLISNEKEMDFFHRDAWQRCYMFQKHLCHASPRKWVGSGYREFIYNYQPSIAERPNAEEQTIQCPVFV